MEGGGEVGVDVGGLVVDAVAEGDAAGEAEGVRAGEHDEVGEGEALGLEIGDEAREVEGRGGDVRVGSRQARIGRVPATKQHVVRGAAELPIFSFSFQGLDGMRVWVLRMQLLHALCYTLILKSSRLMCVYISTSLFRKNIYI